MAGYETYKKKIRAAVRADHNGDVPSRLDLTIDRYAKALAKLDATDEVMSADGYSLTEQNTAGGFVTKQHPLYNLSLQLESLCQQYAKMLGLTAAKAAVKTEAADPAASKTDEYLSALQG